MSKMFYFKRKTEMPEGSNILFVCKFIAWRSEEGISSYTWDISRSLVEKGHDVTILCVGSEIGCENSHLSEDIVITKIPYLLGSYVESISKIAADYFLSNTVKRWINKNDEKFDVVHLQGESEYLFARNETTESILIKMQG